MMDKTIKINIAGTLFQIDEKAYQILRDYLQAINNRFRNIQGGHETIEDIESRIAEIFESNKGLAGVISTENVEAMISIIGKPEDFDHNEPEIETPFVPSTKRRMYRNPDDSVISGLCGGLGAYLNTDPVLFRILFVIITFFGVGVLAYIILWIAIPSARTEMQKREMYGNAYNSSRSGSGQFDRNSSGSGSNPGIGNAINEIFRAVGRVFYIALRIFLIIMGILLVITGFLAILSFLMIFVFKFPGALSAEGCNMNMNNLPDFLNYVVNPSFTPWILGLAFVVFILPILALIYWGVKMIFWFKANDGVFSLAGLVLWVMALAALAVIMFQDGISFSETGKSSSQSILSHPTDTLYIKTTSRISDLKHNKEFSLSLNNDEYSAFINDEKKELYFRPCLKIISSDDNITTVKVRKRSSGINQIEAVKRTEELVYNYSFNGDTLLLDEYFTIPSGRKWAADNIGINLYLPEGTIIKFDSPAGHLLFSHNNFADEENYESAGSEKNNWFWIMSENGLKPAVSINSKSK
jgi:phage shock protein PspC (stress-responsive transcriptional regulator)